MKKNAVVLVLLAVVVVAALMFTGGLSGVFGEQTEVTVRFGPNGVAEAEIAGIDYITLSFYTTTDDGNALVATKQIPVVLSQTFTVSGLADKGATIITAALPDGDSTSIPCGGSVYDHYDHIASGDAIEIRFYDSQNPYWQIKV